MAKKLLLGLLLMLTVLNSGCWSRKEVEDLAIVSAIGIDRMEIDGRSKWKMTFQIFQPQALGGTSQAGTTGKGSAVWVVSSIGETLDSTRMDLNTRTPRVIFSAHVSSVIIGEETARSTDLGDIIDYLLRHKEFRLRNWIIVTEGKASDLLAAQPELENDIATEVEEIIENTRKRVSKGAAADLRNVIMALISPGRDVFTARIEIFKASEGERSSAGGGAQGGSGQQETKSVRLHGAAVFSGERMAGWFSDMETRGALFIVGKVRGTPIPLVIDNKDTPNVSITIIASESEITSEIKEGQLRIRVKIKAEGDLIGFQQMEASISPQFMELLGNKTAQEIRKEAEKSVVRAQEMRADIFGFGEVVNRKYPNIWKEIESQWRDYFAALPVEVSAEVNIRRPGMISNSIEPR